MLFIKLHSKVWLFALPVNIRLHLKRLAVTNTLAYYSLVFPSFIVYARNIECKNFYFIVSGSQSYEAHLLVSLADLQRRSKMFSYMKRSSLAKIVEKFNPKNVLYDWFRDLFKTKSGDNSSTQSRVHTCGLYYKNITIINDACK